MPRVFYLFIFVFILWSCQGPPNSVQFPDDPDEFVKAKPTSFISPKAIKVSWEKKGSASKPIRDKISFEYPKDSVFRRDAFQPLVHPLDSHIVKFEDWPSIDLPYDKLSITKVKPTITILAKPERVKAQDPYVENFFTKGLLEFDQDQGLPGTEVKCIKQDKAGRLWLSTDNGICMYDGENFHTWYKRHGLSRDIKNDIAIDKNGHVWLAGNGVDELIMEEGIVKHYGAKEGLRQDRVTSVAVAQTGEIIISGVDGVDIYDPVKGTSVFVGKENNMKVEACVNRSIMDHQGRIWCATNGEGVSVIDRRKGKIYTINEKMGLGNNDCRTVIESKDNKFWMGNWNGGVDCYDPETGVLLHLTPKHGLAHRYINNIMEDKDGIIWVSCIDAGLDGFDPVNRKLRHLYGKKGIVKSNVLCTMQDKEGRIWFGTGGGGFLRYDLYNGDIDNYGVQWLVTGRPVIDLLEDANGNIMISTNGAGSVIYDPVRSKMIRLNYGSVWTHAWQNNMKDDGKGNFYYNNEYNYVIWDKKEMFFKKWDENSGLPGRGGGGLEFCDEGALLGRNGGLQKHNFKEQQFYALRSETGPVEFPVSCMMTDKDGSYWIGTYNSGLYKYDHKNLELYNYSKEQGIANAIYSLTQDEAGRIWVGTGGAGIKVLDLKNKTLTTIDRGNGLAEMTVTSLLCKDKKIYAGTARGLSIIDNSILKVKSYGKAQGLRNLDFNTGAELITKDGTIWWGIGDILARYKPGVKEQEPHVPLITSINIKGKEMDFGVDTSDLSLTNANDTIWASKRDTFYFKKNLPQLGNSSSDVCWKGTTGPYQLPEEFVIPFDQDHLTFSFTGNYISNTDKVRYRYVLEGLEKEWSPITRSNYVDYRNIPPGNYVFKVSSNNFGSQWSEPQSFSFKITPPWWKSKLAYSVYALFMIGTVFGYNRIRTSQLLKRQKELEHVVDERTKDIADQKKTIEEKQKEIVDSINYAKRIQFTLLAHEKVLKKHFVDHFIMFQPKDIVSGDFYWATKAVDSTEAKNNKELFYLAVCDSTGHGVPGAFMSLLNISFLNEAINEKHIHEPHAILNYVRSRLEASVSREGAKDGMDGILLCFESDSERTNYKITYAAGNNAPVLFSNGELTEQPFNKMPIGKGEKDELFQLYEVNAKKGDVLYLYTDGFADQFGGPKGKKFKYKQLNDLLSNYANESMDVQKKVFSKALNDWKGDFEQVDDICLIGIRI